MKKLIILAMMIILILAIANCTKNEQLEQVVTQDAIPDAPSEIAQEVTQGEVQEISSEEVQAILKEFDKAEGKEYSISEANNKLSVALFKMIDIDNENLVFSSFSVANALAMAAETTNEEISSSIRKGLRLPKDVTAIRDGFQSILKSYEAENDYYVLNIANAVWIDNKYSIEPSRQTNIKKYYLGESISFDNLQPKVTAKQVNEWCDVKTNGMIDKIINAGDINELTHLLLTNALYFKGTWDDEFRKYDTREKTFYNSLNEKSQVAFMNIKENFSYTEDKDVQVLKMNYKGSDFSMLIILPRVNDITSLKTSLTSEQLSKWNKDLSTFKVNVQLPKFKFEYEANLNKPLIKLGMERAFTSKTADELYIDKVLHKAIIDVNEEGTEAAAVTAVAMTTRSMSYQYENREFIADHPFIFVIQDNRNENILFMGKVEEPVYED